MNVNYVLFSEKVMICISTVFQLSLFLLNYYLSALFLSEKLSFTRHEVIRRHISQYRQTKMSCSSLC